MRYVNADDFMILTGHVILCCYACVWFVSCHVFSIHVMLTNYHVVLCGTTL